jgi:hypothetical protein
VALLSECEQLIDTSTGTRHNVEIDATNLLGVNFSKIDAYPKLKTALERADVTNFDWSIGLWSLDYTFENEWLKWGIYTRSGDDPWGKELYLFYLDCTLNLHEIIDKFKDEVSKIIPLKHISDIDAILKNLQDELRNEGWGDETPECRIEISKGIGKYKIIVRLMESGKRIDEIDLPDEVNRENIGDYTDYLFSEGIFSGLNIINKDDFYTELYSVLLGNDEEY